MYVRVDLKDEYIYLLNNVEAFDRTFKKREMRARELLGRPRWWYQRIKRLSTLPPNKKLILGILRREESNLPFCLDVERLNLIFFKFFLTFFSFRLT